MTHFDEKLMTMRYTDRMNKLSKRTRFTILMLLGLAPLWIWGVEAFRYSGSLVLIMWLLFPEIWANKLPADKTKNMLKLLARDGDLLRVGMETASISIVRKVALSEYDEQYGFLQFPYTSKFSASYLFPIEQMAEVRDWFATKVPELEIIR